MSETSLMAKLQLEQGQLMVILEAPEGYVTYLSENLPGANCTTAAIGDFDAVFLFVQTAAEVMMHVRTAVKLLKSDATFWIAYPKKSGSLETDLTRDKGWGLLQQMGWRAVRQVSLDDDWSVLRFRPADSENDLLSTQYANAKTHLRPIFDRLTELVLACGSDIQTNIRKSYVAFSRENQFALIQPSTQKRVDLGLKLKDKPFTDRLQDAGNLGSDLITHKVALTSPDDIDSEVVGWLKEAYEQQVSLVQ